MRTPSAAQILQAAARDDIDRAIIAALLDGQNPEQISNSLVEPRRDIENRITAMKRRIHASGHTRAA